MALTFAQARPGILSGESGGDYNALWRFSNRPGAMFSNVVPTQMTLDQVLQFQEPSGPYGSYVNATNQGVTSTPVGAYQIIGTTLGDAKRALGLRGDEVFSPELQDRIAEWIFNTQGVGAWAGYKGPQGGGPQTGGASMQPQQSQPMGLLARMGMQKQDPNAGGETAMPFYQRPTFANFAENVALALNPLRTRPDQNLEAGIQAQRQQRMGGRTAEWLAQQPGGEVFARAIQSGANPGQVLMAWQQSRATNQTSGVEVGGRLVNPVTGEVIYDPVGQGNATPEQVSQAGALRDDLTRELEGFNIVKSGYENIMTFYKNPNAVSDYALAVAFAKVLDPGSVAREGEVSAVQNAGARVPALGQALKNAITGEGQLTDDVRRQIADATASIYAQKAETAQGVISRYETAANQYQIPWDLIYMGGDIPAVQPVMPAASAGMPPSAVSAGVTQEQWNVMTDQQRAAFQ